MSPLTRFRRRERHGLHVADPIAETIPVADALTEAIPEVAHEEPQRPAFSEKTLAEAARIIAQVKAEKAAGEDAWWGLTEMDMPPALDRPYVPAPEPLPAPPMPFSGVSSIWVATIRYPDPCDFSYYQGRDYRETLRHIGKATGTSTSLEDTGSWPRLELEAGGAA